jgi:hypothetical protein
VKTLERLAPLDEVLTDLGEQYLKARNTIEAARRHGSEIQWHINKIERGAADASRQVDVRGMDGE